MVNIAIIGFGYWGPNLVRNFSSTKGASVKWVADLRSERLETAQRSFPTVQVSTQFDQVMQDPEVHAVVIATPVFTHFELAMKALQAGKHVLLEKPMTESVSQAKQLIQLAETKGLKLMVDHTFLYTSAVQKMKQLIDADELGTIKYFDSTRINLGLIQQDVNVLWDLAPHDISILNYLIPAHPRSVQATGVSHIHNGIENIAYLTVNYDHDFIAHFHCSWSSPVKIRMMLFGGDKKMVVFNDMEPTDKIRIYDTAHTISNDEEKQRVLVDYRVGDIHIPKLPIQEALSGMAADFVRAIQTGSDPIANYKSGLFTIKVLEAAQISIKENGREVIIAS
ncbi:MAG: Gfo/Idh/MocA family protein [Flavobacteriales bacterium]